MQLKIVNPIRNEGLRIILCADSENWKCNISGKLNINNVFAGVGNPIKLEVCLVSTLNFAKRYAEATVTNNPINGI